MKKVLSVDMVSGSATQNGQMTMKPTPKPTCSNVEEAGIEMVCIQLFVFTEMMINRDDEDNESNIYEMLTTTTVM